MRKLPIFLSALLVIVAVVVLSLSPGKVYSANVGDQLTAPESGWTRYETDSNYPYYSYFSYSGSWFIHSNNEPWSGGWTMYSAAQYPTPSVSFTFTGTKLRVIALIDVSRNNNIVITIDGNSYSFSEHTTGAPIYQALCYESDTLANGWHQVTISKPAGGIGTAVEVDAIDLLGALVDPTVPTPSPTPVTTPAPSPELCYDYSIVGSLGSYNPGTIAPNSQSTQAFTVTGTQLGDLVQVSFDQDLQGITLYGYVSAANQVTVVFQNRTGGNITLTSGNVRVHINRHVKG